jgi:hypothetical protein
MSLKEQRLMQLASETAQLVEGNMKHCALLVKGKKIIKKCTNNTYSHAENGIIKYINRKKSKTNTQHKKMKKYDLYICRVSSGGNLRNSKPCMHCVEEIKKIGLISKIVYSDFDFYHDSPICVSEKTVHISNSHITFGNRYFL